MKVTIDGEVKEMPFLSSTCTGYVADKIEISADDVMRMRLMAERNPAAFQVCMLQLEYRFAERRVKRSPFKGDAE